MSALRCCCCCCCKQRRAHVYVHVHRAPITLADWRSRLARSGRGDGKEGDGDESATRNGEKGPAVRRRPRRRPSARAAAAGDERRCDDCDANCRQSNDDDDDDDRALDDNTRQSLRRLTGANNSHIFRDLPYRQNHKYGSVDEK